MGIEASNNENPNETTMTGAIPKKTINIETLEVEKQREAMAKENKILREQNKIQLEQHQMMAETLTRNLDERLQNEREDMARQLQEMRDLMAQAAEGNQQNENPGAQVDMIPPEEPVAPERVQENDGNNAENNGEPIVVNITDQNRHLISDSLGGMIVLPSGTLRLTPQFVTKQKNPDIQRMKEFARPPTTTPQCVRALDGHPQPSNLNLHWTHEGEWAKIPIERFTRLNKDSPHEIVRVESYIDEQGVIRKAVSYGR